MGLIVTSLPRPTETETVCSPAPLPSGDLGGRQLVWNYQGGTITSDAGGLLLKRVEQRTRIVARFAACFTDYRKADRIEHPLADLVAQRVYGLALGYEDLNDHDQLRCDPMLAVLLGKQDPQGQQRRRSQDRGKALAGKSTLNRLELTAPDYDPENAATRCAPQKIVMNPEHINRLLVDVFLEAHSQPPQQIVLDVDVTDDPLHGQQEGRFFHGYYREYCYLPLYIFCGEYLLCAWLRPSNSDPSDGAWEEVERIVMGIRARWPEVQIVLRGDGGFCREPLMHWCENNRVHYVLSLPKNNRLKKIIGRQMHDAEQAFQKTRQASRVFTEFDYQTQKSWSRQRRVIAKAEHLDKGANPRFVVTSLTSGERDARSLYEDLYCARGEMENRIKEQQLDLFADRTSTSAMWSNQVRLYFSSIAYVLMQALRRLGLQGTEMACAQCGTIRLKLLKIGAHIRITVRKVWVSMASGYPWAGLFAQIYAKLGSA
jgi:DDE family transposase